MHPCSASSWRMQADSDHSASSHWPNLEWWHGVTLNACLGHFLILFFGTLNNGRYISIVLGPVALPFFQTQQKTTFQWDNAWLHVAWIVRTLLNAESVLPLALARTFSRSLINNETMDNGCRTAGHYCGWIVAPCWNCIGSCTCTHSSIRYKIQRQSSKCVISVARSCCR